MPPCRRASRRFNRSNCIGSPKGTPGQHIALLRIRSGARRSARPPGFRAVSGGRKRNRTRSQGRFWAVADRSRLVETAALDRVRSARHHATRFPQAAHFVPSLRRLTVGRKSSRPHVEHNLPITLGTPLDPPRRLDAHRCRSPAPRATPGGHLVILTSLMAGLRRSNVRQVYPHSLEQTCLRACGGSSPCHGGRWGPRPV
jgi:hypothetical protein